MTLDDLLKFNKEIDAFDYFIIIDKTDTSLKTCNIVTDDLCFLMENRNLEVIKTHKIDGVCLYGICESSQRGLVVEVSEKKPEMI